jgi:hypothetical protein
MAGPCFPDEQELQALSKGIPMSRLSIIIDLAIIGAVAMMTQSFVERMNVRRVARIDSAEQGAEMLYRTAGGCLKGYYTLRGLPRPSWGLVEILSILVGVDVMMVITCFFL